MAEAFGFYADNLLTRDHFTEVLNARFAEQDERIERRLDAVESKFEQRTTALELKIEQRTTGLESKIEQSITALDSKVAQSITALDSKFEQRFGRQDTVNRLHTWMLGILVVVMVIPQLQAWLG